jgi:hypothetical protein
VRYSSLDSCYFRGLNLEMSTWSLRLLCTIPLLIMSRRCRQRRLRQKAWVLQVSEPPPSDILPLLMSHTPAGSGGSGRKPGFYRSVNPLPPNNKHAVVLALPQESKQSLTWSLVRPNTGRQLRPLPNDQFILRWPPPHACAPRTRLTRLEIQGGWARVSIHILKVT